MKSGNCTVGDESRWSLHAHMLDRFNGGLGVCRIQRVIHLVGVDEDAVALHVLLLGGRHAGSHHLDFPFNVAHQAPAIRGGFTGRKAETLDGL